MTKINATSSNAGLWTHVEIDVKGTIDGYKAKETLEIIDKEINEKLSPEEKPPRVSYSLDDNSKTLYQAKSCRIRGTEPIGSKSPERHEAIRERFDPTPPGSPKDDGHLVKNKFVEVELGSD
ncbi:hypothetical protein GGR51DRAFT_496884 [Nemania sp. FL0031]|nr:hypothetical protein GGR51DRAFT_496884 [Nemania sp. FL0031]